MTLDDREIVSVDVAAPAATVWEHVRDPRLVRRWFGWDHDDLDDEIRQIFVDGAREVHDEAGGVTTRTLWWPHHDALTVTAHDAEPDRTRVTVTRRRAALLPGDGLYDEIDEGWIAFVHQLRFALERHPGEDRVTLSVLGLDAGDRRDPLLFRAGLHGVRGLPVGAHVDVTRPDRSRVGGTVVYRTEHQVGIRLHGIESLLVLMLEPVGHRPPNGRVSAVLSTYGLDDDTLATARRRWAGWWGGERASA